MYPFLHISSLSFLLAVSPCARHETPRAKKGPFADSEGGAANADQQQRSQMHKGFTQIRAARMRNTLLLLFAYMR